MAAAEPADSNLESQGITESIDNLFPHPVRSQTGDTIS
jgi:hypothetical protein